MEYKGMQLDDDIGSLIRYMPQVDSYREALSQLQAVWDNLALLGQLSGVGGEMGDTRESFFALSQSLINQLAREHYQRVEDGIKMKASVSVDMMLRNLFERTADIGFLATDEAIRHFMRLAPQWHNRYGKAPRMLRETHSDLMRQRLQAYVAKYSVYNNVILLSPVGEVLFQLVETGIVRSQDAFVQASLLTTDAYIEVFRATDLLPNVEQPLIYAYRITDEIGEALGVLCLCFDFQDECRRIFAELDDHDWAVMLLTNHKGQVIASHDPIQIPLGSMVVGESDAEGVRLQRFSGRQYLSVTRKGKGYQGYSGQGWMGHVMVPLEFVFEQINTSIQNMPNVKGLDIFSEALMMIPVQADQIQERLNRSVWNGNVRQARHERDAGFGRALLNEVSQTGLRTKAIFSSAIENLYQTVIGATLENNRFLASLAVNIMDRNLYERANDCRWWALSDVFRQALAKPILTQEDVQRVEQVLCYINQLYTVYTGLIVYDKQGCVLAVSQPHLRSLVGKLLSSSWVKASLNLVDSQRYVVSDFEQTPLYEGKATYIYAAAIMHPDDSGAVGGIGIIFDSQPQFASMLADAAPDGHGYDAFAVFYDDQQRIVSTTHPTLTVGGFLPVDMSMAQAQGSAILSCGYGRYAVGVALSSGYREYKGEADGYQSVIYAAMFKRIGALLDHDDGVGENKVFPFSFKSVAEMKEVATFVMGAQQFALPVSSVVESVDVQLMARVAVGSSLFSGYIQYRGHPVPVIDLSAYLGESLARQQQAIVVEDKGVRFAVLVDALGSIVSVPVSLILPIALHSPEHVVESLISDPSSPQVNLIMLSVDKIRALVIGGRSVAEAMPELSLLIETAMTVDKFDDA